MKQRALFWLTLPFAVPQALRVRRAAMRLAPASGEPRGRFGDGVPLRLLGIGDSIIAGVGAEVASQTLVAQTALALQRARGGAVEWQSAGRSGERIAGVRTQLLRELDARDFDAVIVSVGVNDVTGLTRTAHWARELDALCAALRANSPRACIAFAGLPPMHRFPLLPQPLRSVLGRRARVLDEIARLRLARHAGMQHVALPFEADPTQFCADGFHPSAESYRALGELFAARLAPPLAAAA